MPYLFVALLLLASACGPATLNHRSDPIQRAVITRDDGATAICPGERVQLTLVLEGEGGKRLDASDSTAEEALRWSDFEYATLGGSVDTQRGVFEVDPDALRFLKEGYHVQATLKQRPEVTARGDFELDFSCLERRELPPPSQPVTLTLGYAETEARQFVIARLERSGDAAPEYLVVDPPGPGDDQTLASHVNIKLATEHPELLDYLSLLRNLSGGPRQLLTPPNLERHPQAELFEEERAAGLRLPTPVKR